MPSRSDGKINFFIFAGQSLRCNYYENDRMIKALFLDIDVSPNCDCHPENDVPIVPDVGMFASADPVALDLACAEAINRQPVLPNSAITDLKHEHDCDRFHAAHDNTHWQDLIEHGKKLGIGQDTYELVTIR